MKETMVIYDGEGGYGDQLARMLSRQSEFPYAPLSCGSPEALKDCAAAGKIDLLLCRRDDPPEVRNTEARNRIYLTDVRGYPWIDRVPSVYMYQSVPALSEEILRKCREPAPEEPVPGSLTRVRYLGIASPVGRCGKTGFALTMGQLLAQSGKVLYLNFEACSGLRSLLPEELKGDLSEILYEYETRGTWEESRSSIRSFHGLDIVPPVKNPEDIFDTEPGRLRRLTEDLAARGNYDIVILDLGQDLRFFREFLPLLQRIYIPGKKDGTSEARVTEFRNWIRQLQPEADSRTEELILPFRQNFTDGRTYLEQLLWSEQGNYVRELLGGMN